MRAAQAAVPEKGRPPKRQDEPTRRALSVNHRRRPAQTISLSRRRSRAANRILEGAGETLTNADVIEENGTIGAGSLALSNSGSIDANVSGGTLTLNGSGPLTNTGTFEATSGGHLDVPGAFGGAGRLEVGANSTVELGGATSEKRPSSAPRPPRS